MISSSAPAFYKCSLLVSRLVGLWTCTESLPLFFDSPDRRGLRCHSGDDRDSLSTPKTWGGVSHRFSTERYRTVPWRDRSALCRGMAIFLRPSPGSTAKTGARRGGVVTKPVAEEVDQRPFGYGVLALFDLLREIYLSHNSFQQPR